MWMILVCLLGDIVITDRDVADTSPPVGIVITDRDPPILTETKQKKPKVLFCYRDEKYGVCVGCENHKRDIANWKDCPFEWKLATPNKEVSYPFICWQNENGVWCEQEGWDGTEKFVKEWTKVRFVKPTPKVQTQRNLYNPQWTWPGNLKQHLESIHGIRTNGMTQDQMEQTHDASHNNGFGRRNH